MQNSQVNIHLPIGHIEFLKTFNKSENRVVNGGLFLSLCLNIRGDLKDNQLELIY